MEEGRQKGMIAKIVLDALIHSINPIFLFFFIYQKINIKNEQAVAKQKHRVDLRNVLVILKCLQLNMNSIGAQEFF